MSLGSSTELTLLVIAVIVGLVQLLLATVAGSGGERDMPWLLGPRDVDRPVTGVAAGRLGRAYRNFLETFPLFAAALIAALMTGKAGTLTVWGAWFYVIGRIVYVPLYAVGVPMLRTLAWTLAMIGIVLVVVAFFR
jgi:uncharacterized MAPEG superfamily protein